jgi:hypothetical protein
MKKKHISSIIEGCSIQKNTLHIGSLTSYWYLKNSVKKKPYLDQPYYLNSHLGSAEHPIAKPN